MTYTQQFPLQKVRTGIVPAVAIALSLIVAVCAAPAAQVEGSNGDKAMARAVLTNLIIDLSVPAHLIDVSVKNGVVTLSGSVSNALAADRAVRIVEATRGVKSVVNNIDVAAPARSDAALLGDIRAALVRDPATEVYEIEASVTDGFVTLTGTVQSWAERKLAEMKAKGVTGVRDVKNRINVTYPEKRADAEIERDIERLLAIDVVTAPRRINVEVNDGKVKLSGEVGSAAEVTRAMNRAWVNGVHSVNADELEVTWYARDRLTPRITFKNDEEVREAVRDALKQDPRLKTAIPDVHVNNGAATLTGTVTNLAAKKAAGDTALNTVGVRRVVNLVRVRPDPIPPDPKLEEKVKEAIRADPYLDAEDMSVASVNGRVYLRGEADSSFNRDHAEALAMAVDGVVDVENKIVVHDDWSRREDYELKQEVESQLFWSPFVDEDDVTIEVEDGTVILAGTVTSWSAYRAARENALEAGAREVRNGLRVQQPRVEPWF